MASELELKAIVPDADALRRRLDDAGASLRFVGGMQDRLYDRNGELGARDEVLRVRTFRREDGLEEWQLAWKGPTQRSPDGYKLRDERECDVTGDTPPSDVLESLGYRVVRAIDRMVEIFRLGEATLRIETYPRMDVLLEVEGPPDAIEAAIVATGIARDVFSADSLNAFVSRFEARGGRPVLASRP